MTRGVRGVETSVVTIVNQTAAIAALPEFLQRLPGRLFEATRPLVNFRRMRPQALTRRQRTRPQVTAPKTKPIGARGLQDEPMIEDDWVGQALPPRQRWAETHVIQIDQ